MASLEERQTVYNFEVEGTHTYFVGTGGVWAHNVCAAREAAKVKYHPRIRARGVQDGVAHNFPYSFDKTILSSKGISLPRGGTGYAVRGSHNGKDVVYNIVVKDGVVTHRDFVSAKNWAQRSKSFGFNVGLDDLPGM